MVISFIGHGELYNREELSSRVRETIKSILVKNGGEKMTFFCGGYGDFDLLCAHVLYELKKEGFSFESFYITPYLEKDRRLKDAAFLQYYDGTIYPPLENRPLRFAIVERNRWMIEKSDLILAFVTYSFGGAAKGLAYAEKRKKVIINLA